VGVGIGTLVETGVNVDVSGTVVGRAGLTVDGGDVWVEVGVTVGPNHSTGQQLDTAQLVTKTRIMAMRYLVSISLPRYQGRARQRLRVTGTLRVA
jgi:hypothetical protein